MSESTHYQCSCCHNVLPSKIAGGAGYGVWVHGEKVCYDCCGVMDEIYMIEHDRITLYLDTEERTVSNWSGSLVFGPIALTKGRHNIAGVRYDVWFAGPNGTQWHGVQYGNDTQLCHCKRLKDKAKVA